MVKKFIICSMVKVIFVINIVIFGVIFFIKRSGNIIIVVIIDIKKLIVIIIKIYFSNMKNKFFCGYF